MNCNQRNFEDLLEHSFGCSVTVPRHKVDSAWRRVCLEFQETSSGSTVIGTELIEVTKQTATWRQPAIRVAAVAVLALAAVCVVAVRNLSLNHNSPAFVEIAGNGLQRVVAGRTEDVFAGKGLAFGEVIHSNSGSESLIVLKDKSRIEMRSNSELALAPADDGVLIQLNAGSVIITAAKQPRGHLYVRTRDLTASVVKTVFVVNAEQAGSRVAVIQGEVRVKQGIADEKLLPGQQVATNPLMEPRPINREVSWSPQEKMHLALLQKEAPAAAPPKKLKFEVDSIRPAPQGSADAGPLRCQGVDGTLELLDPVQATFRDVYGERPAVIPRGRCTGRSTLADLIGLAYGIKDTRLLRPSLMGGEPWVYRTPEGSFQIEAKAEDPATVTKSQLQQMLQAFLSERFKLKISWQTQEFQGFVMYASKDGAKLPLASSAEPLKQVTRNVGDIEQRTISGKASMDAFLDFISKRPPLRAGGAGDRIDTILDRTGLMGTYVFNLSYTVPPTTASGGAARSGGAGYIEGFSPAFPNMRDALQEQLGLRLESAKVPTDHIVIEHAERPSEN